MQKCARERDVVQAVAWLHEYAWGDELVFHLACDSRTDRIERFLTMVDALRSTIHDNDDNALLESISEDANDNLEIAGEAVIVPNL
jgi:hypothetical protein